jgi:hypothetical protein
MKKFIFAFALSLLIIGCLTDCSKNKSGHLYIPQLNKDLALFNKNSYWFYLNEKTSKPDCTYVKSDPQFYTYTDQDGSSESDNILVPYDGKFFLDVYMTGSIDGVLLNAPVVHCGSIVAYAPFKVEKIDSLYLNNHKFLNVYHTRFPSLTVHSDSVIFDTYMVPHIGIIKITKKTLGTDTTLSIVRWNVIQ